MKYIILSFALFFATFAIADEPVRITDLAVAEQHAEETGRNLVLVFTADWCQYCKPLEKQVMDNMKDINEQGWVVCFVDYDSNKDVAKKYGVTRLPTSVFLNGEKSSQQVGYTNYQAFERNFKK